MGRHGERLTDDQVSILFQCARGGLTLTVAARAADCGQRAALSAARDYGITFQPLRRPTAEPKPGDGAITWLFDELKEMNRAALIAMARALPHKIARARRLNAIMDADFWRRHNRQAARR